MGSQTAQAQGKCGGGSNHFPASRVTVEEILQLADFYTVESVYIAVELYNGSLAEYAKADGKTVGNIDQYAKMRALANVWDAGRIQGIRDERRKRAGKNRQRGA